MSDVMESAAVQLEPVESVTPPPVPEAASISDHAAAFSKEAKSEEHKALEASDASAPADETPQERQQRRDKATGQFREGKVRHRAKSAQATAADVPRIQKLTVERNQEREARTAVEAKLAALEAEVQRLKVTGAPAAQVAEARADVREARQEIAANGAPDENDPKYAGDWQKYQDDRAAWIAEQKWTEKEQARQAQAQEQQWRTEWTKKVDAVKAKYPDYEQVAFLPAHLEPIPQGSVIDNFVRYDDAGPEILYHLHKHPEELDAIFRLPTVLAQAKHLALLSQRFASSSTEQAGNTGSAARRNVVVLPPKPPNPVRTEAQRVSDAPVTDGSLSIAEHSRTFGAKRR